MEVSKESTDIMWMATMKNLKLYLNSMDVTGMGPDRNRVQHHHCLTMHQLYILAIGKSEELRRAGYQVVGVWECDYDKRYKDDPDFRNYVDSEFTNLDPLRPSEALFGGRSNSTKLCVTMIRDTKMIQILELWCTKNLLTPSDALFGGRTNSTKLYQ